ncbi:TPA: hypothetical protein N0F65_004202, partial [Lagenidium giganteum]
ITISLPKSQFGKRCVDFLSHRASRECLQATPRNLESVLEMPFPETVKGVQMFVGCFVHYHRFIDSFATLAASLYELTDAQLAQKVNLESAKRSFYLLKQRLANAPMLVHPQKMKPFVSILYVCPWAFGAVIAWERNGVESPTRFVSKVFKDAGVWYTDSENEVLALLKVLDVGLHHLAGSKVTVYARYSTLKWLFQSMSLRGTVVQWVAMLSPWDLTIVQSDEVPRQLAVFGIDELGVLYFYPGRPTNPPTSAEEIADVYLEAIFKSFGTLRSCTA